jgi:hypothetical protein
MMKNLECVYDSRKSFYGKAKVETNSNEGIITLYSYGTKVACIKDGKPELLWNGYSQTTYRHIAEFFKQNGFMEYSSKAVIQTLL